MVMDTRGGPRNECTETLQPIPEIVSIVGDIHGVSASLYIPIQKSHV